MGVALMRVCLVFGCLVFSQHVHVCLKKMCSQASVLLMVPQVHASGHIHAYVHSCTCAGHKHCLTAFPSFLIILFAFRALVDCNSLTATWSCRASCTCACHHTAKGPLGTPQVLFRRKCSSHLPAVPRASRAVASCLICCAPSAVPCEVRLALRLLWRTSGASSAWQLCSLV
jgi:hypothetical protein